MTDATTTIPHRRGRAGMVILLLIGIAGGIYAGTRWHARIGPVLGMNGSGQPNEEREVGSAKQLWTCGMHPQVIQDHPGDCPICHMKLTPLKMDAGAGPSTGGGQDATSAPAIAGEVVIDPAVVQNMGVRTALATEGPLRKSVRIVGYLDEAEPSIHDINLRVSGWIRRLYANTEGMHVEAGDRLFDLYSPELQVAIEELIAARRAGAGQAPDADRSSQSVATTLFEAAVQKLELAGLPRDQIDALAKLDRAPETVTFTSPVMGHVTEKPVVDGAAVKAGDRVLRVVDHSTLWLDGQVFEKDLPFVRIGERVTATIASDPGESITGEVAFVHPHVDMMTRTALVRLTIPNPSLTLKPGMYATVKLTSQVADRAVMVPREAVIDTGERQVVFIARAAGRFEPRQVKMGLPGEDGMVQVLDGLAPGDAVVISGQFLLDSESRLREAIQKFISATAQPESAATPPVRPSLGSAATGMLEATPAQVERVDAVVAEYLSMSGTLGAVQTDSFPALDMTKLIAAAHALQEQAAGTSIEPLAVGVAKAAEAMKGHPLDRQRQMFSALSGQVIVLVDAVPPSSAITGAGGSLYLMHCPMPPGGTKGDWLQSSPDVANPFFAADMKQCGEMVRAIRTRERRQP